MADLIRFIEAHSMFFAGFAIVVLAVWASK